MKGIFQANGGEMEPRAMFERANMIYSAAATF
jgi:hypothetical protein